MQQMIYVISGRAKHLHDNHWFTLGYVESREEAREIVEKLREANAESEFCDDTYGVKGNYERKEYGCSVFLAVKYGKRRAAHAYASYNDCCDFIKQSECDCVQPLDYFKKEMWEKQNWKKSKWANF